MFHEFAYVQNSLTEETQRFIFDDEPALRCNGRKAPVDKFNIKSVQKFKRRNSLVIGQKLRESKWFNHSEINILCAVLESGFIVEKKDETSNNDRGIALWSPGYEKSKNPDYITIYTVELQKGIYRVQSCSLLSFWTNGSSLKINNQSDQTNTPNSEEVIRNQIVYAQNNKHKWHNSEHFTYWCRYGSPLKDPKTKLISDSFKWGHFGLNAGLFLLRNQKRAKTVSK